MSKARIILIAIIAIIALATIAFSINQKGYERIGMTEDFVVYYDSDTDFGNEFEGIVLKNGFYEVRYLDALANNELNEKQIKDITDIIDEFNSENE